MGLRPAMPLGVAQCSSGVACARPAVPVVSPGRRRLVEHVAWWRSCRVADGVVHQVGPSGTARGSSEAEVEQAVATVNFIQVLVY